MSAGVRRAFARLCRAGGWPLYLFGPPGRGKSTAALWFADHAAVGLYCTAREVVDAAFGSEPARQAFGRLARQADLVAVDQFGMGGRQGAAQTQAVIDLLEARDGRPLILVSNLPPEKLAEVYDAQVLSRVSGGTVVGFDHLPDYRLAARQARDAQQQGE